MGMRGGLTKEGPDMNAESKVIAVEFTLRRHQDGVQQEVEMFACSHTVPAVYGCRVAYDAIFTLHTSHGDQQVRGVVLL